MKIHLPLVLFFFFPFKNDSISTHPSITINSKYFSITTDKIIPEQGNVEYENMVINKWVDKTTPIMKKIGSHFENKIPAIFNELKLQIIPFDSTYIKVWEESVDNNDVFLFLKSEESYCRYTMRISNLNVLGGASNKDESIQLESAGSVNNLFMEVIFDKNMPNKSQRELLKKKLTDLLNKIP